MDKTKTSEFLAYYELYHWRRRRIPSAEDLKNTFGFDITELEYEEALKDPYNFKHLLDRCIPLPKQITPKLQPKQLELISILTDPSKRLTLTQKLKLAEVSALQYSRWLDDPLFAEILYDETNKLTANARDRVLGSLVNEASSGNVQAQKLYLELSGEYTPKQQVVGNESEFKQQVVKLMEILKKYVDEDTLLQIALELETVLFNNKTTQRLQRQSLQSNVLELE